jgi:hypothetical protein
VRYPRETLHGVGVLAAGVIVPHPPLRFLQQPLIIQRTLTNPRYCGTVGTQIGTVVAVPRCRPAAIPARTPRPSRRPPAQQHRRKLSRSVNVSSTLRSRTA